MVIQNEHDSARENTRPQGRDAVTAALKQATLELLAEQGISFSTRDVAARANVNQGLIHRHFGSKQELLVGALTDRNSELQQELINEASPFDVSLRGDPPTAILMARLILDNATSLIEDHVSTEAVIARAANHVASGDEPSAPERAAIANAISLGWAVFGNYAMEAAGVTTSAKATSTLRAIVDELLDADG